MDCTSKDTLCFKTCNFETYLLSISKLSLDLSVPQLQNIETELPYWPTYAIGAIFELVAKVYNWFKGGRYYHANICVTHGSEFLPSRGYISNGSREIQFWQFDECPIVETVIGWKKFHLAHPFITFSPCLRNEDRICEFELLRRWLE